MDRTHFSRLTLRRESRDIRPLIQHVMPTDENAAMGMHHRLLWTLFADRAEPVKGRSRFLWRQAGPQGRFFVLGPEPATDSPWFKVESRPFDVRFRPGQNLAFELRVNATVDRMIDPARGRAGRGRVDLVLDALHRSERGGEPKAARASRRQPVAADALKAWLATQGERYGFRLLAMDCQGYRTVRPPKGPRNVAPAGIADVVGLLEVTDPSIFSEKYAAGFGRMKAFGCGLMLVRPA